MTLCGLGPAGGFAIRAPLRALAIVLVLLVLPPLLHVEARMAGDGKAPPEVYVGTPRVFLPGEWNLLYDTSDDLGPHCLNVHPQTKVVVCNATWREGNTRTLIDFGTAQSNLPKARAGVGVKYDLKQRCAGQDPPAETLTVSFGYRRWVNLTVPDLAQLSAEIFASANARVPGLAEDDAAIPGNVRAGRFVSTTAVSDRVVTTAGYVGPTLGTHDALIYAKADPGVATPAGSVLDVSLHLEDVSFDWGDVRNPTLVAERRDPSGARTPMTPWPASGGTWVHEPFDVLLTANDASSCPRWINYTVTTVRPAGVPNRAGGHDVGYDKAPLVLPFADDGVFLLKASATDWAGNVAPTQEWYALLDRVPPTVDLSVLPSTPTGDAGWYKASGPTVHILCTDAVSQCAAPDVSHDGGATWSPGLPRYAPDATPMREGDYLFACRARDQSGLANGTGCQRALKVDTKPPQPSALCRSHATNVTTPCGDGAWRNESVELTLTCSDGAVGSGCLPFDYSGTINGTTIPWKRYENETFNLTQNGRYAFHVRARDVAGNFNNTTLDVGIDRTPPRVWAPSHGLPTNVTTLLGLTWRWDAPWEPWTESGVVASWLRINGSDVNVTDATSRWIWREGETCVSIWAQDAAGNRATPTAPVCIVQDATLPQVELRRPEPGYIYKNDVRDMATGSSRVTVVLGRFTFESVAWDNSTPTRKASGVVDHHTNISLTSAPQDPTRIWERGCPEPGQVCRQVLEPPRTVEITTAVGPRHFSVHAMDRAGNWAPVKGVDFDYVGLVAVGGTTSAGASYALVDWLPYVGDETFVGYEIHRGATPDFTPNAATRVHGTSDLGATSWRDKAAVAGATLYYRVLYVTKAAPGAAETKTAGDTYPARPPLLSEGPGERVLDRRVEMAR